jgi:hypothetical protein
MHPGQVSLGYPTELQYDVDQPRFASCRSCGFVKGMPTHKFGEATELQGPSIPIIVKSNKGPRPDTTADDDDRISIDQPISSKYGGDGGLQLYIKPSNTTPEEVKARKKAAKKVTKTYKDTRKAQNQAAVKESAKKKADTPTGRFRALKAAVDPKKPKKETSEDEKN